MKKKQPENPEKTHETIPEYVSRGGMIIVYSVPENLNLEVQHVRPKGLPMVGGGFRVGAFLGE